MDYTPTRATEGGVLSFVLCSHGRHVTYSQQRRRNGTGLNSILRISLQAIGFLLPNKCERELQPHVIALRQCSCLYLRWYLNSSLELERGQTMHWLQICQVNKLTSLSLHFAISKHVGNNLKRHFVRANNDNAFGNT